MALCSIRQSGIWLSDNPSSFCNSLSAPSVDLCSITDANIEPRLQRASSSFLSIASGVPLGFLPFPDPSLISLTPGI